MTHNQIEYWKNQESIRHNRTTEVETNRHNVATENIDISKLGETSRHNRATEGISLASLGETTRHNRATETIGAQNVNLGYANVGLGYSQLGETTRHNQATEELTAQRQEVQNMLDTTRSHLNSIEASWASKLNSSKYNLTQAQIDSFNAQIEQIYQHMNYVPQQNVRDWMNTLSNMVNAAAKTASTVGGN